MKVHQDRRRCKMHSKQRDWILHYAFNDNTKKQRMSNLLLTQVVNFRILETISRFSLS